MFQVMLLVALASLLAIAGSTQTSILDIPSSDEIDDEDG
jgi:hypothetical protein